MIIVSKSQDTFNNFLESEDLLAILENSNQTPNSSPTLFLKSFKKLNLKLVFEIIVPINDNAKNKFPESKLTNLRSRIRKDFGGFTEWRVVGEWTDSNHTVYRDESILFKIAVPLGVGYLDLLESLIIAVKLDFEQVEIFAYSQLVFVNQPP
ncbi:MAG: hypothetical protein KIH69_019830 [Anaerolineae bacterium]|nr:hypothetical protein [Anaerolineae bacterium]